MVQYKFTNDDENFWCNVVLNLYLSNNILIKFRFSIKKKKKKKRKDYASFRKMQDLTDVSFYQILYCFIFPL